jgi:ATP-binding protein involved in chromosome partitioning
MEETGNFPGKGHRQKQQQAESDELLPGVKNIIAVASGKGGVGKSTIAVNLACGLARTGAKVGLLDTDIYGPSIPTMFDTRERPNITTQKKLVPLEKYGVRFLSMGLLVDPDQAMIWRGPMVTSAVKQFMQEVEWGELDYMVLDLPPGTGDIQLTLVQTVPLTGAVIVSTPQTVALDDARKGVAMFKKVNVPVLGIVENMAYFVPPDQPDKKYYIFGKHGARELADRIGANFLGEIPLEQSVRESGDNGKPIVLEDLSSKSAQAFVELSNNVIQQLALRNQQAPTEKVEIKFKP